MLDIGNLSQWHRQDGSAPARTGPSCLIRVDPRKSASDMSFKLSNRSRIGRDSATVEVHYGTACLHTPMNRYGDPGCLKAVSAVGVGPFQLRQ